MDIRDIGKLSTFAGAMALALTGIARAEALGWAEKTIADAVSAAPPSVSDIATILDWTEAGKLGLALSGTGPSTCLASESVSLRIGKPALPYPDRMWVDQNDWALLQAVWAGGEGPLPTASGLISMLAGMNVGKGAVDTGANTVDLASSILTESSDGC